jgi:hypothetical protein
MRSRLVLPEPFLPCRASISPPFETEADAGEQAAFTTYTFQIEASSMQEGVREVVKAGEGVL